MSPSIYFGIFLLISLVSQVTLESIEVKKYPPLQNVEACIPPRQNGISCNYFGGSLDSSKLKISCLKDHPATLIVQGKIESLKIICSSHFPIDFEYDGVQPTEALLPIFTKTIIPNVTTINPPISSNSKEESPKLNFADYFPATTYNVELLIFGVEAQYDYFHDPGNPFFPIKSSDGHSHEKSTKTFYSRTGNYMFRDIHSKAVLYSFYLFFEEEDYPLASFIVGKSTQNPPAENGSLPCLPSHHKATIILKSSSGLSLIDKYTSHPTKGIEITDKSLLPLTGFFTCEIFCLSCKDSTVTDKLTFSFLSKNSSTNPPNPYGFEELPPMLHYKDLSITLTYIFYVIEGVATVRPTCDTTGSESGPSPGLVLLTNIPCRNPMHCRLMREFISPKFMNGSYSVEFGQLTEELFSGLRLDSGLPFTYGLTMCQSTQNIKALEYGVSLDGRATAVSYGFDWLKLPGRAKAEIKIYLNIGIVNQKRSNLYAGRSETFRCQFFSSVLIKPVIWMVELTNGTMLFETMASDFFGDTSFVNISLKSDTKAVHCGASLYYKNLWRQIRLPLNVLEGSPPNILANSTDEIISAKQGTKSLLLRCSVEGEPIPDIRWERNGKILKSSSGLTSSILEIEEVNEKTTGDYECIAWNHLNESRYNFNVNLEEYKTQTSYGLLVGLPLAVFLITAVSFIVYIKFFRKEKNGLTREEIEAFLNGDGTTSGPNENNYSHEFSNGISYNTEFEVPSARFNIEDKEGPLGSGAFGMVLKGNVYGRQVAAKTVTKNKSYLHALLSELKIMIYLGKHENIVELVGAFTSQLSRGNVYIFVELCGNGSAEKWLRNNRNNFQAGSPGEYENLMEKGGIDFDEGTLLKWSMDVALAMEYLAAKKVIHGDLAARNILLTDDLTVKVTDFGLSRQLHNYSQYVKKQQEPLPWRWMALESLRDLAFDHRSDAWAYGVLLWEFFSLAEVPYPGYSWNLTFVNLLEDGLRMAKPKYATEVLYQSVILECWRAKPEERPTFSGIIERLEGLLESL